MAPYEALYVEDVFLLYVGKHWERDPWLVQIGFNRHLRRSRRYARVCWYLRVAKKSYEYVRRRDLEFAVGDQVMLRVSPTKVLCGLEPLGSLVQGILDHLTL
jgi:hypothetical protein